MEKVAVIDVGSNAIRLLGVSVDCLGAALERQFERYALRLGTDVFEYGKFKAKTISSFEKTCHLISQEMLNLGIERYWAVATSAMRDASNGAEVAQRIFRKTGLKLDIISGIDESALSRRALLRAVGGGGPSTLLLDLGGGSLELEKPRASAALSLPFGTVRLLSQYPILRSSMSMAELEEVRTQLRQSLYKALGRRTKAETAIGTGGNLTVLARYLALPNRGVPCIDLERLKHLARDLAPLSMEEKMKRFALRPDRADLAVAATLIVELLVEFYGTKTLMVPGTGLREELLYALLDEDFDDWLEEMIETMRPYRMSSRELRRRIRIARQLYTALWPLHRRYPIAQKLLVLGLLAVASESSCQLDTTGWLNCLPSTGKLSLTDEQERVVVGASAFLVEYEKASGLWAERNLWQKVRRVMSRSEIEIAAILGVFLQIVFEVGEQRKRTRIRLDMQSQPLRLRLFQESIAVPSILEKRLSRVLGQKIHIV